MQVATMLASLGVSAGFFNDAFEAGQFTELVYRYASFSFYKVEQVLWVPDSFPEE